jgi:hypothetical protein
MSTVIARSEIRDVRMYASPSVDGIAKSALIIGDYWTAVNVVMVATFRLGWWGTQLCYNDPAMGLQY